MGKRLETCRAQTQGRMELLQFKLVLRTNAIRSRFVGNSKVGTRCLVWHRRTDLPLNSFMIPKGPTTEKRALLFVLWSWNA